MKDREIRLGERTLILGVLNVTPTLFRMEVLDPDARSRGRWRSRRPGPIFDIGAESTRPGFAHAAAEELRRLVPVLKRLRELGRHSDQRDTYKAEVAGAPSSWARIINDPSGLTFDPQLTSSS